MTGDGEWVCKKHVHHWLKLHLAVADHGEIQVVEVTICQYSDSEMLDQIAEPVASVNADGVYDTKDFYDALVKRNAKSIIPPL